MNKKIEDFEVIYNEEGYLIIKTVDDIEENSVYEITFHGLSNENKTVIYNSKTVNIITEITPCYCTPDAVRTLVDAYDIDDETILYFIKEASRRAEYLTEQTYEEEIPYNISQYVRYRAAYESILKFYIELSTLSGRKGAIGEITFEISHANTLKDLLKQFKKEVDEWEATLLIREHGAPTSVVRSSHHNLRTRRSPDDPFFTKFKKGYKRGLFI